MSGVIVSCAITGAVHVPSMTPHLPCTPEEIARSAIEASEAGATIVHLHARERDGKPTGDPAIFAEFLPDIHHEADAIINISTGAAAGMGLEERIAAVQTFSPELCSLNMGSMNFGIFPLAESVVTFKHDWEHEHLERTRDIVFRNTFADIEEIVEAIGPGGTRFEFECYDVGHLYNLAFTLEKGLVKPPLFIQTVFGILGGIGPEVENLMHMRATADRLFGTDYVWSVLGAGRHQTRLVTAAALCGGNVRVGLEDSIYLSKGVLAESNADQVRKIIRILRELSLEPATPDDARTLLALKGRDATKLEVMV